MRPSGALLSLLLRRCSRCLQTQLAGPSAPDPGEPDPSPLPSRSPSPPVAALLSSHRRTGRTPESAAPPPLAFSFFPCFGILLPEPREVLRREERGAGVQAFAAARKRSWATASPASPLGLRCSGWDVTKGSPQHLPPALEGVSRSALGDPRLESLCLQRLGTGAARRPGAGFQLPLFGKNAVGITAFLALGTTPGPAAGPSPASRRFTGVRQPACTPCNPSSLSPAPGPRSAPRPYGERTDRGFLSAGAAAVQTARWGPPASPS